MWVENNTAVLTGNVILIWDGLTKPDVKDDGSKTWNVRVAIPNNAPELQELEALRQQALRNSKKPNVTVSNPGNNPLTDIDLQKFPELPGHKCFSASTTRGPCDVFSIDGATLSPMQYGPQIFNGLVVRLIVDAYAYDNKQKGINFGLQSMQIIDATAPRLSIGASGMSTDAARAAFMGAGAPQQQQQTPPPPPPAQNAAGHQPPPPPHTSYMGGDQTPPPPPPPAVQFPPVGWFLHPQAPGSYYNAAGEIVKEADLRARVGA